MGIRIWIPLKFPSLNEYINLERRNKFAAAKMKREWTDLVIDYCNLRKDRFINKIHKYPVTIIFNIHEKDKRRDIDNVSSLVSKFCLDGMQKAEIIKKDSQQYVEKIEHNVIVDGTNGVEVIIDEKL